jgi:hypothetical protein
MKPLGTSIVLIVLPLEVCFVMKLSVDNIVSVIDDFGVLVTGGTEVKR